VLGSSFSTTEKLSVLIEPAFDGCLLSVGVFVVTVCELDLGVDGFGVDGELPLLSNVNGAEGVIGLEPDRGFVTLG
jgi:hypothetical protein